MRNGFLLPVRVVRLVYRGKFLQALEKLLRAGDLQLPPDLTLDGALAPLRKAAAKKWNVRIQERYEHGRGVATYLARYMRGGPIKNSRILGRDDKSVSFRYGDHRASEGSGRPVEKTMSLSIEEFLGRLLSHVPLPGMQVVRGYGLYSRTDKERLEQCRSQLAALPGAGSPRPEKVRPVAEWAESLHRCPVCGKQMVRGESICPHLDSSTGGRGVRCTVPSLDSGMSAFQQTCVFSTCLWKRMEPGIPDWFYGKMQTLENTPSASSPVAPNRPLRRSLVCYNPHSQSGDLAPPGCGLFNPVVEADAFWQTRRRCAVELPHSASAWSVSRHRLTPVSLLPLDNTCGIYSSAMRARIRRR